MQHGSNYHQAPIGGVKVFLLQSGESQKGHWLKTFIFKMTPNWHWDIFDSSASSLADTNVSHSQICHLHLSNRRLFQFLPSLFPQQCHATSGLLGLVRPPPGSLGCQTDITLGQMTIHYMEKIVWSCQLVNVAWESFSRTPGQVAAGEKRHRIIYIQRNRSPIDVLK